MAFEIKDLTFTYRRRAPVSDGCQPFHRAGGVRGALRQAEVERLRCCGAETVLTPFRAQWTRSLGSRWGGDSGGTFSQIGYVMQNQDEQI